tara:strand:- start:599 stop:1606 length:1008 start_codon:yes stop_codon:yes gene_type:complete
MKKINWGILSTAKIAREHIIPALKISKNSNLYAIASRSKSKAVKFSKKFKFKKIYGSYKELYEDKNVNIIYNPLPNHLHLKTTIEACRNKKHVLLEKPITLKAKEVDQLIKISKKNNVIVKEAFMVRYHSQWLWAKKIIKRGEIGKIRSISTLFSFYNDNPRDIRNIRKFGGGAIYDIGCYPVLISRFLLDKEPKRVIATSIFDNKFKTDILSSAILDFGGIHSSFVCSTQSNFSQQVTILGTKKTLILENPFNPKTNKRSTILIYNGSSIYRNENQIKLFNPFDQYCNQVTTFSNHLLLKTKIDFGLKDSKKNMLVLDAIFKSLKQKKWINIAK